MKKWIMPCWFFLPSYWQAVPPTNKFHTCKHPSIWTLPARIPSMMPASCPRTCWPSQSILRTETAAPFNLIVATAVSNQNRTWQNQPVLQQYLVDNKGNIDFPVLGILHIGGLTKSEAETSSERNWKPTSRKCPSSMYAWPTIKFPSWEKWPTWQLRLSPTRK